MIPIIRYAMVGATLCAIALANGRLPESKLYNPSNSIPTEAVPPLSVPRRTLASFR